MTRAIITSKETAIENKPSLPGPDGQPWTPFRYGPKEAYDAKLAETAVGFPQLFYDQRFWHVIASLISFFVSSVWQTKFQVGIAKAEKDKRQAQAVKRLLIELGPTYIKLGQFLSVRRDLLPVTLADELISLQDRVPPFDISLLRQIVVKELGAPPEELFAFFDPVPMASASIGQVHRVQLKDGRQAVLKVQRVGLSREFYRDLGLLRLAAKTGLAWDELNAKIFAFGRKNKAVKPARFDFRNWLEMSDEFGRSLFSEIDYLLEGRNADRLRRLLRDRPEVRVPRVIWKHSGHRVLTLEFIEGTKIDQVDELKARGIDLEQVGNLLIACYLEQIVIKGFFHADPHAGNLAVDQNGHLVIYDFGMTGEISETQRRRLLGCVLAVINRDAETLVRCLVDIGVVRQGSNLEAISRAITPFMEYYSGKGLFDLDFRQLERDIDTVVCERSLKLPANLAYILRAGSSLEGIARTLKSDFSFVQAVKPVARKLVAIEGLENLSTFQGLLQLTGIAVSGLSKRVGNYANGNGELTISTAAVPEKEHLKQSERGAQKKCRRCYKQSRELIGLKQRLGQISLWGIAYVGLSMGTIFMLDQKDLSSCDPSTFYCLVGNIILGGVMIWNFASLLRWNPKSTLSEEAMTEKKNAQVVCSKEDPRR